MSDEKHDFELRLDAGEEAHDEGSDDLVMRFDASNVGSNVKLTSQGFLRIPARLTRTGIVQYRKSDGTTVRELRHPDEVFKADSIASLSAAPVTVRHPGLVTPENVKNVQVGIVSERIDQQSAGLDGFITVQDSATIKAVQARSLVELSPGYLCKPDPTPGVWNGERYDAVQRDIRYNHVALLPKGGGRQGAEVALRMDAAYEETIDPDDSGRGGVMKVKINLDGIDHEVEVADNAAPAFKSGIEKLQGMRQDAADKASKFEGQVDALKKEVNDLKTRLDAAEAPAAVEKKVAERLAVCERASKIAPELKMDGLSLAEIRKEALVVAGFDRLTLDSKEEAYITGAFESLKLEGVKATTKPADDKRLPGVPAGGAPRMDAADDELNAEKSRKEMLKRNRSAWEGAKE